jgi:predicted nicotinamide N-methyase
MDPQTLPAKEQALYHKIKKQFKVGFEPLQMGEHRLNLLKPIDLEQLLGGKDPLKNPSEFPFWIRIWESSIVLGQFLAAQQYAADSTVLELGAGLGVSGLAAAAAGARVTLTDYEETILEFEQVSAAASGVDNVRFKRLDWLSPPRMERYNMIIGAEVLFREDLFQPLLGVIDQALEPDGVVYLAHDVERQSVKPFLEMAEERYRIGVQKKRINHLEKDKDVLLTRLVPKK